MASGSLRRRTISPGDTIIADVVTIGWTQVRRADVQHLLPHQHEGWEITWVRRGQLDWLIDGQHQIIRAGECVVIKPGEIHSACSGALQPSEIYWITLADPPRPESGALESLLPLLRRAARCTPGRPSLAVPWKELIAEMASPDRWSVHAVHGAFATWCAHLARCLTARPSVTHTTPAVQRAIDWVESQRAWIHPIGALAREAGMAPATLHARFVAELGLSPSAWMRRRRLEESQRLMRETSLAVTAIATRLGFNSSQHFATQFRRWTGATPQQWRSRAREA